MKKCRGAGAGVRVGHIAILGPSCKCVRPAHVSEHFCVIPVIPGEECKGKQSRCIQLQSPVIGREWQLSRV